MSLSITLIATTAKIVAVCALGATASLAFLPAFAVGGVVSVVFAATAWKKYATSQELASIEEKLGKIEGCLNEVKTSAEAMQVELENAQNQARAGQKIAALSDPDSAIDWDGPAVKKVKVRCENILKSLDQIGDENKKLRVATDSIQMQEGNCSIF